MRVPLLNLSRLHASMRAELDKAYDGVMNTSGFVGGKAVADFENDLADAHRLPGAAACGSGSDALTLSLLALGVGREDEVIVPSMTFVATAEAVVHAGATPVIADVDPRTLLLNDATVEEVRTAHTRAVIPVHLYGHLVPFDTMRQWRDSGLTVVEDAAQAILATWNGESIGAAGDAACFSFYPGKNLGALGDGGAVLARDAALLDAVRRLRDHGRASKYEHGVIGFCSRLDGLQAAFLRAKLAHLDEWTIARRSLADQYQSRLGDRLVPWTDGAVHHLVVVRVTGEERDAIRDELKVVGIETGVHYPVPLSLQTSCARWARACPGAESAAAEIVSLPIDPLMTENEVDYVCDQLLDIIR